MYSHLCVSLISTVIYSSLYLVNFACSYPENIMPDTEGAEPKTMVVGTNNVFEVGCGILIVHCFSLL